MGIKNIRSSFELYRTQHNNIYPALSSLQNNWLPLLEKTSISGNIDPSEKYGPYMQQPPKNPWTEQSTVVNITSSGDITDGWRYDENTGEIAAVGFDESTGTFSPP